MPKNTNAIIDPNATAQTTPAPYLPFRTFQTAYEALEHGIPKKLDRTIWPSQSGMVQSQILTAFRFLGLVDDQDRPTELLQQLVQEKENRAEIITMFLNISYTALVDHDLTKMTPKMVEDEMERYHVSGDTKRKAVTFFLRAAKFAGMPMHPLLSSLVRNTGLRKRQRTSKSISPPQVNSGADPSHNTEGRLTSTKNVRLSNGGRIVVQVFGDPFALPAEERKMVFELMDRLQEHADANPFGYEEEESC